MADHISARDPTLVGERYDLKFSSEEELTSWTLQAQKLWLFLDYDGTLVDFARTPDQIDPDPEVINLLHHLVQKSTLRVTIISGRRLQDIRALLPVPGMFVGGTYGLELLTPDGKVIKRVDDGAVRPFLDAIKPQWMQIIAGREGFFLEDKGMTLALHARFADESEANQVLMIAHQKTDGKFPTGRFRILGGDRFLEIAPYLANKREAVFYLLQQYPWAGTHLLYIGDDDKDEEAFAAVHASNGVAVKVAQPSQASRPTEADYLMDSPADVVRWLGNLVLQE
jgi:trehalose 6-phosphate phosphatase